MKLTDFMLYNALVENVQTLILMIDEQNESDIIDIENLRNRANFLLSYGECPKYLENKIDSLIRQLYGEFFVLEDGKTYNNKNKTQNKESFLRVYTAVPVVPFVETKRLVAGKFTDGEVSSKIQLLLKAISSKELAEKTLETLTVEFEQAKGDYKEAKKEDVFADGKVPFFKRKQNEQIQAKIKDCTAKVITIDTKMETVKEFIQAIDENAYFGKTVREVIAELSRYQQSLPKKVSDRRKTGENLNKQAIELEEGVVQRNCLPLQQVAGSTIMQRYKEGVLPPEFLEMLVKASLSEKEFSFLMGDEKLKEVLSSVVLPPKAKTDKELVEKLICEALQQLMSVKTNSSMMGE